MAPKHNPREKGCAHFLASEIRHIWLLLSQRPNSPHLIVVISFFEKNHSVTSAQKWACNRGQCMLIWGFHFECNPRKKVFSAPTQSIGIFFQKAILSRTIKEIGDKRLLWLEGPYGGPGPTSKKAKNFFKQKSDIFNFFVLWINFSPLGCENYKKLPLVQNIL